MASKRLTVLVILSIVSTSLQDVNDNEIEDEEINPFAEAASAILKEQNAQNIASMVNNFVQSGGAAQLGDMVSKFGGENAGQLLQGLASLVGSEQKQKEPESSGKAPGLSTDSLIQGLGAIAGVLQGAGGAGGGDGESGNVAGALLQGLGSLLVGPGGQGGQGIDPSTIGTVLNMLMQSQSQPSQPEKTAKTQKKLRIKVGSRTTGAEYELPDLFSLLETFLTGKSKINTENLLNFVPMILQTIGSFTGPEAAKRAESHSGHSSALPAFLEKIHLAFDNFIHSDMGKYFISSIGAEKAFKVFMDENGRFSYQKFSELMENLSFRRHWIRMVTDRIVYILRFASDPKMQKTYLNSGQYFLNSFLKSQDFPKATFFDPNRSTETISALADYIIQKYLDVEFASKEYVKPIVEYVQDINRLAQKSGAFGMGGVSKELSNKLADTINLEIIEPVARVNRAYRFAKLTPSCDRYVMCTVNEINPNEVEGLPGVRKLLTKGTSLLAAWFLSGKTGTPFWTLYSDILENDNCKALYSEKCHDFHLEEIKVTTEYVHNEL